MFYVAGSTHLDTRTREAAIGTPGHNHSSNKEAASKPTLRLTQSIGMFHP
ncbi:hypothetical protein BO71DRAFT_325378 [Aspergillus ellipticus CBS 707.79]|uniref:Uncharacterized protein n=1 Tax=Aspergillus ellipticus CBS 707.79 TaxID=1448320 RepID=A0A319E1J0_9EURO|nr:hypothetical protein BO71DRAFT_325378 [Aspergillus ellipticus CBS 707.79]